MILTILNVFADERDSPPYCQSKQSRHPRGLKTSSCDQNVSKQFAFLGRSCKNLEKSSNFRGREGESRRLDIGPKQMAFPSKVGILVLFKKRFLLKKTINRKLQRQKVSKFTNL